MKVLVTGGAGFIGSNLVERLYDDGHDVVVIDNLSKQIHGYDFNTSPLFNNIKDKCTFYHLDVSEISDWAPYVSGIDAIVHLAAETGTGQSMYDIQKYCKVNIQSTASLVEYIILNNIRLKKFIIASSRSIYGEGKYSCSTHGDVFPVSRIDADMQNGFFDPRCPICDHIVEPIATCEMSMLAPRSIYAVTKLNQEQTTLIGCQSVGIDAIALRFQNVYGPGQSLKNPYTGILSIFSTRILNNQKINVFEDGLETRDFVYISDVIDSIMLSINSKEGVSGVFNVGSGVATSVNDVINKLSHYYALDVDYVISGDYRVGDIRHNFADTEKAKIDLGFKSKVDFDTGISNFCSWVKKQEIETSAYETSLNEMRRLGLLK